MTAREEAAGAPATPGPLVTEVETAGVRIIAQELRDARVFRIAIYCGDDPTKARHAIRRLTNGAANQVIGHRLGDHRCVTLRCHVAVFGLLLLRQRLHYADRPALAGAARELGGAEDGA